MNKFLKIYKSNKFNKFLIMNPKYWKIKNNVLVRLVFYIWCITLIEVWCDSLNNEEYDHSVYSTLLS